MLSLSKYLCVAGFVSLVVGCSSIALQPEARSVLVSPNQPPKGCKYVGQVSGNQGNFFTGGFTSNQKMEEGAMNDMKNKASALGGNYIQLITNRAGDTGSSSPAGGEYQQTNVTDLGNVFNCPNNLKTW